MLDSYINELTSARQRLAEAQKACLDAVRTIEAQGGARVDVDKPIQNIWLSIVQIHSRILALDDLFAVIDKFESSHALLLPRNWLDSIPASVSRIADKLQEIAEEAARTPQGQYASGDETGFVFTRPDKSAPLNITAHYQDLSTHIDTAYERVTRVLTVTRTVAPPELARAITHLSEILSALTQIKHEAEKAQREISANRKKAASAAGAAGADAEKTAANQEKSKQALEAVVATQGTIAEILKKTAAESDAAIRQIQSILANATALHKEVTAYEEKFREFDKRLSERTKLLEEGNKKFIELTASLEKANAEATDIITDAKEALGWGTVQSLTESFSRSHDELKVPLERSIKGAYFSFVVLALWVILVLVAPARIDPSLRLFAIPEGVTDWTALLYYFGSLGVRLVILAPAFMYVIFTLNRYQTLFALREQYQFKKTVASAIPGFKEQAADDEADQNVKAMTLAAFEKLLFNPGEDAKPILSPEKPGGWGLGKRLTEIIKNATKEALKEDRKTQ